MKEKRLTKSKLSLPKDIEIGDNLVAVTYGRGWVKVGFSVMYINKKNLSNTSYEEEMQETYQRALALEKERRNQS